MDGQAAGERNPGSAGWGDVPARVQAHQFRHAGPASGHEQPSRAVRIFAVGAMIVGATTSLVLGLTMPVVELTYFYIWSDTHSFISIVRVLYAEQELFLAGILVIFSMLFPAIKLIYLLAAYAGMTRGADIHRRMLNRMSWLGKWSMLDVLVLALVIFYVKASAFAEATTLPGIYFFSGAVLLTMIAYALVEHSPGRDG